MAAPLLACAAVLHIAVGAAAQEPKASNRTGTVHDTTTEVIADRDAYRLVYDHVSMRLALYDERNRALGSWDYRTGPDVEMARAALPPDRPVRIVIENANALLYRYSMSVDTVEKLDVRTCASLGGRFLQQAMLVGVGSARGITIAGPALDSLFRGPLTVDQLAGHAATRGESKGARRLTQAEWETLRQTIGSYIDYVSDLGRLAASIERALPIIAEEAEAIPLDSLLKRLEDSVATTHPDLRGPQMVARAAYDRLNTIQGDITELARVTTPGSVPGTTGAIVAGQPLEGQAAFATDAMHLRVQLDSTLTRLPATYRRLEIDLLDLKRARAHTRQAFAVSRSGDLRRLTINLRPNDSYKDIPRVDSGSVALYLEPVVRLNCALSIGASFMGQPPKYEAHDGVAANTAADETRTTVNVMLHVWSGITGPLTISPGLGLGVNKSPDLYLGGSLRTFAPVYLTVGAVWQRRPELPDNLAPPAPVTAAQLDHLPKRFRAGWFVGLSLTR